MDKEVQIIALIIIGVIGIMTSYTRQVDIAQVCVAGIIGFIGAKATEQPRVIPEKVYYNPVTAKKEEPLPEKAV